MTLFDRVFGGNDAVYGLTEGAIDGAIAQYGEDKAVSFPNTAYSLPCYYAVTGTKVTTLKELKEAGYDENNPFTFELSTSASGTGSYSAQILQHQLAKAGIVMKLRVMEWQAFLNTVVLPRKFEAVLMGWSLGLKPDAYSIWHSESRRKGGFNFVGYQNETVDQLIKQAEKTVDQEAFDALYREIFALIVEDNPYLFLVIPNSITVVNKAISPVSSSIIGVMHNTIDWMKADF